MMLTRPDNAFGKFTALFPFSPIEIAEKNASRNTFSPKSQNSKVRTKLRIKVLRSVKFEHSSRIHERQRLRLSQFKQRKSCKTAAIGNNIFSFSITSYTKPVNL